MSQEIEIEKTYLVKYLPKDYKKYNSEKILDIYIPKNSPHSRLRIRKKGLNLEITKKRYLSENNSSTQLEETINLTKDEYKALSKINGNIISKTRYYYPYKNYVAEIEIFSGKLKGLVLIEFEFKNQQEFNKFIYTFI